ncbi:MAG TPA: helix-turn-helix domain-containing protein [Polyangiaceae bacterium]|jgi:excisionase family DNA binding protein|nr:helix-turn-helix domain-containing protein [Polyangiaceae bacterium]
MIDDTKEIFDFIAWRQEVEIGVGDPFEYLETEIGWLPRGEVSAVALPAKPKLRPYLPRRGSAAATTWIAETIDGLPATLTTDEVCAALRMSRRNLYRLVGAGKIVARKMADGGSSRLLIPRAELERYLKSL